MTGPGAAFIVGGVIAVLGGLAVFSYLASSAQRRPHQCRWTPVAVSDIKAASFAPQATAVLQKCDGCGELESTKLIGTWTLDQVRGSHSAAGTAGDDAR
ncbi:hypothetical protein [Nonomuraea bangladeshensis]|uniref:hypothetical protein n=1 Tax=Nonomuraea bangladeshensis TaxID=404385 RepID=UPI0031CF473B